MPEKVSWATNVLEKIDSKIQIECSRLDGAIPYIPENGHYSDMGKEDLAWWTNGFWGGILWQLGTATNNSDFVFSAENLEKRFDENFEIFEGIHHDAGFMWLHTSVANYRLTGNHRSYQRSMHAATILAGRFNTAGNFIRCWNEDRPGWIIIDSMMNIPLLYWASNESDDPRFRQIALKHADTVKKYLIREDGSVNHIAIFNPENGEFSHCLGGQGYSVDSSWSRGQGWAIYGFALSYKHTKNPEYLAIAKKVANYVIGQLNETNYIALADYRSPKSPEIFDSSASAIAACGLLEIASWVSENEKDFYYEKAYQILQALAGIANWDFNEAGIIPMGSVQYHGEEGRHVPIIYSDYFFIEGILRLLNKYTDVW